MIKKAKLGEKEYEYRQIIVHCNRTWRSLVDELEQAGFCHDRPIYWNLVLNMPAYVFFQADCEEYYENLLLPPVNETKWEVDKKFPLPFVRWGSLNVYV